MASGYGYINLYYIVNGTNYLDKFATFDLRWANANQSVYGLQQDTTGGCYYISFDNAGLALASGQKKLKLVVEFTDSSLTLDSIKWVVKSKDGSEQTTYTQNGETFTVPTGITWDSSVRINIAPQITSGGGGSTTTYTVSYDANGGTGAPESQTKTHGVTLTLSSHRPTRNGYTFLGWSKSSTATTAAYSAGGSYTANSSVTLYAVWQKDSGTIYDTFPTTPGKYYLRVNGQKLVVNGQRLFIEIT